jgi:succinate dehydrogenase / fumarate reductase membrane anchor subunit
MDHNLSRPKHNEGVWLWLAKIIGGLLVIVVLGIHFVINHAVAPGGLLTYADVIRYYKVPIVPIMEGFFLVVVVSHSLLGLRGILLDMNPTQLLRRIIDWVLFIAGSAAIIYGIWLLIVLAQR